LDPPASSKDALSIKVAKGGAIAFLGQGATRVASFALQLVLSNGLGVKLYGVYSLSINIMEWAQQICLMGTPSGLVRFSAAYSAEGSPKKVQELINSAFLLGLCSSLVGTGILLGLSGIISEKLVHDSAWSSHLRWFFLSLPVLIFFNLLQALMRGFQRIDKMVLLGILRATAQLFFAGSLLAMSFSLAGVMGAYFLGALCAATVGLIFLRKMGWSVLRGGISPLGELLAFSFPVFLASFSHLVVSRLDLLLLGYFHGAQEAGLYRAALTVASMVNFILGALNTAFAPMISELHQSGRGKELEEIYGRVTRWVLGVALPLGVVVSIFSFEILQLFGRGFEEAGGALIILAIAQLCNSSTGPVGFMLQMTGKERWFMVNYIVSALVNASSNLVLIPALGATGAAIGTGFSIMLVNVLGVVELWIFRRIHPWSKLSLVYLMAAAIGALAALGLEGSIGLWPVSLGGAIVVYLAIVGKAGLPQEDRMVASTLWSHLKDKILGQRKP
jgi:O-antigen/teichoic acid export membrane protein